MDDLATALARLEEAHSAALRAQEAVREAVVSARGAGATWAQIGVATGVTRQSAHERWGHIPRKGCGREGCGCQAHRHRCGCGHE